MTQSAASQGQTSTWRVPRRRRQAQTRVNAAGTRGQAISSQGQLAPGQSGEWPHNQGHPDRVSTDGPHRFLPAPYPTMTTAWAVGQRGRLSPTDTSQEQGRSASRRERVHATTASPATGRFMTHTSPGYAKAGQGGEMEEQRGGRRRRGMARGRRAGKKHTVIHTDRPTTGRLAGQWRQTSWQRRHRDSESEGGDSARLSPTGTVCWAHRAGDSRGRTGGHRKAAPVEKQPWASRAQTHAPRGPSSSSGSR